MSATWDDQDEKLIPIGLDEILLIDTEDSRNQKRATLSSINFGETNTSSNSGTGEGVAQAKDDVDLPFKSLLGETNRIVLTGNTDDITFTIGTDIVTLDSTQTLTNKTINANNNTISNLTIGSEVTGASTALSDTDNIVYLNTANTYSASVEQDFGTSDIVNVGKLSVGTDTPLSTIHALSVSEQLRLSYDDDNYISFVVNGSYDLSTTSYDSVSFNVSSEDTEPRGIAFNNDGSKMYIIGADTDAIYQYSLTTPFDISTSSYDEVSLSIAIIDSQPTGLAFNDDGTKMFFIGRGKDAIYQYSLTTSFDLSTASYDEVTFDISSEDAQPVGIIFNNDGSKMYMAGDAGDSVYQYSLTTEFDISTASYDNVRFFVTDEDTNLTDVIFNDDGTKMFIAGTFNDSVYQYSLTTAFDISTASYDSVSFSVASEATAPRGIRFNNDGTKIFIVDLGSDTVYQYSLDNAVNITPTNEKINFNSNVSVTGTLGIGTDTPLSTVHILSTSEQFRLGYNDSIYVSFVVNGGYDLTTASYDDISFPVSNEDTQPRGVRFNDDGTKMYICGFATSTIYQYSLTTSYDISTSSYDSVSLSVSSEDAGPMGLIFNDDGTKLYVVGNSNGTVYQYSLTTEFDLSTASYDSVSFPITNEGSNPTGITFNTDGTKMYICINSNDTVFQYSLTTGFDLSTASYDDISFSVASEDTTITDVEFNDDGTKMYVVGNVTENIFQYSLTTAFDLSTASYNSVSFSIGNESTGPTAMSFNDDGTQMFIVDIVQDTVYRYSLDSNVDITPTSEKLNFDSNVSVTGTLGIGTDTPLSTVHALSTTEQFRLGYNDTHYISFDVNGSYDLTTASYDFVFFSVIDEDTVPQGIAFNTDGTKMFMVGANASIVFQYSLTTGFDLSTTSYDSISLSVISEDSNPSDIEFNTDGTKMYIVGETTATIYQYSLTTAYDLSTASYDSISFHIGGQDPGPTGMAFNDDGNKMYITGNITASIYQYSLTTSYDLSTASYDSVSFSVTNEDDTPHGIAFSIDGMKLFMVGIGTDTVYQYSLSSGFDISTASYDDILLSVSNINTLPTDITFNDDGTKIFVVGRTSPSGISIGEAVYQYSITGNVDVISTSEKLDFDSSVTITGTLGIGTKTPLATIHALSTSEQFRLSYDDDNYISFIVNDIFNVSAASYDDVSFLVGNEDVTPHGIIFNNDGSKMYMNGTDTSTIYQYSLTTSYDVSTASYDSVLLLVSDQDVAPRGIAFNDDGTKMYMCGNDTDEVYQYSLTTAYDLSTASYDSISLLIGNEDATPQGISFNTDGTKLYMVGNTTNFVYQYDLTTGFDLSTASYDGIFFSIANEGTSPTDIKFNIDGTKMYISDSGNDSVHQYSLTTSFDLSTVVYDNISFSVSSEDGTPTGFAFDTDGTKMYVCGNSNNTVYQYSLIPATDIIPTSNRLNIDADVAISGTATINNQTASRTSVTTIEVYSLDDLPDAVSGVITLPTGKYIYKNSITFSDRLESESGASVIHEIDDFINTTLTYTGSDTFITGNTTTFLNFMRIVITGANATFLDITDGTLNFENSIVTFGGTGTQSIGTLSDTTSILLRSNQIQNYNVGLIMTNCTLVAIQAMSTASDFTGSTTVYDIDSSTVIIVSINNIAFIGPSESIFNFDPTITANIEINGFIHSTGLGEFYKSGTIGDITSFADTSLSSVSVTSVTDDSGDAVFTTGTVHSLELNDVVDHTGFTESTYNDTGLVVTEITSATQYKVAITYVATDTGTVQNKRTTLTCATHGLTTDTTILIKDTTNYNGGFTIKNPLTDTFEIQIPFVSDDATGSFNSGSLDQTSTNVNAHANTNTPDSATIAFGTVNGNTTATTVTNGTYAAIDVTGFEQTDITERFQLTNADNAIWTYIGEGDFKGFLTGGLWATKTGSTQNYRFAMSTNGATPIFASVSYSPMEVQTDKVGVPLEFEVNLTTGDTIQIMNAGDGTSDSLIVTDMRLGIK